MITTAAFPPATGRYVRFRIHALTGCRDCDWLFLGEGRVGKTSSTLGRACTADSDCGGGSTCDPDPDLRPRIVIGQPGFVDASACNGDSTGGHAVLRISRGGEPAPEGPDAQSPQVGVEAGDGGGASSPEATFRKLMRAAKAGAGRRAEPAHCAGWRAALERLFLS
jgi:hypothetical protein